jgi:hypothetical protein
VLPGSSATAAASKFIIQGKPINISDNEADDSPMAKVASTASRVIKTGKVPSIHMVKPLIE